MKQLDELESDLDALTAEILLPLRASKELNSDAVSKLYKLADDVAPAVRGSDGRPAPSYGQALVCVYSDAERGLPHAVTR
jgi:hypothetical protein